MDNNLDDYDYDFAPSSSNTLRSLFDKSSDSPEHSTLTYTAPKQPKPGVLTETKSESVQVKTSVICAKVVHVWKLVNGKYQGIDKHGCAIIGTSDQSLFELILYKEKRNVIMRIKISQSFEFFLKKDDFASFYDNVGNNWLIKFNNNDDGVTITKHIEKFGGKIVSNETNAKVFEKVDKIRTESDTSENKTRAEILSRITKMGQSILPSSETESVEDNHDSYKRGNSSSSAITPTNIIQSVQNIPNAYVIAQPMPYDPLNVYVAESRTHNTEVRMNLSQISEKLNCIMKLVDDGKSSDRTDNEMLKCKIKVLELRIENLLKELATAQDENVKLKVQMEQESNILKNEEQNKFKFDLMEEEKRAIIEDFQRQIELHKDNLRESSKVVELKDSEIEGLRKQLSLHQDEIKWKDEIPKLKNTIFELQKKSRECEKSTIKRVNERDQANFESMLKEEMNEMYENIVATLNHSQNSDIKHVIVQNIKHTTLKIIQNFQQLYEIHKE